MENLKPEPAEIKPADAMEEGQRILANIIARELFTQTRKVGQSEFPTRLQNEG